VRITAFLNEALSARQHATLAVSGGKTPVHMFDRLSASELPWDRIHLFWVDERPVPPADPQSNYRLAEEWLIRRATIPHQNIHRILSELQPEKAAERYCEEIREFFRLSRGEIPQFDVIHRGMGSEGHTASLFPGEPLIGDRQRIAAAVYVEKLKQSRITLLPGVLLAARRQVLLVTGENKAETVRAVLSGPYDPKQYPAQLGRDSQAMWFLDDAAAKLLN
jgi:6-phosphogluconolactonase